MKLKKALTMPVGALLLAIAIMLEKFLPGSNLLDFIEGFLIGLSIVLNLYYVIVVSRKNKKK